MKISRTDAHDRLQFFNKQADHISQGCEDCIKGRPEEFGDYPFYIFAHKREINTDERVSIYNFDMVEAFSNPNYKRQYFSLEDVPSARMIWQARLTRPRPQENSMCFKHYPLKDIINICWIIPSKELLYGTKRFPFNSTIIWDPADHIVPGT